VIAAEGRYATLAGIAAATPPADADDRANAMPPAGSQDVIIAVLNVVYANAMLSARWRDTHITTAAAITPPLLLLMPLTLRQLIQDSPLPASAYAIDAKETPPLPAMLH